MNLRRMGYREFVALMAVMSMTIAAAIDVMLPAFDEIKETLGLAPDSNAVALTISIYFIGMACSQVLYGPLADRFGRKPVLYFGLAVYAVGAAGSTLASSLTFLLWARFVWGLGAAALRVLSITIVRDVVVGDKMARVMSLVMTVFLLGPVIAPLVGQGLLQLGSWRYVFGFSMAVGAVTLVWSFRLDETLDPADRRPLGFTRTREGFRAVVTNRQTLGYSLALTFVFGILLTFLASSQLMFDEVYGKADQFAFFFSLASVASAVAAFINSRLVERKGSHTVMNAAAIGMVLTGVAITTASVVGDGRPPFWLWFALMTAVISHVAVLMPTGNAIAMQPMGHLAGTASAVIGTFLMGGGSLLGAIVDSRLESSVTPMSVGFLVYGIMALVCIRWARRGVTEGGTASLAPANKRAPVATRRVGESKRA